MQHPPRFRLFMILQLCLGFSVLVWLLICPSILERGDYRARETLALSIEKIAEKHPTSQSLSEKELSGLPLLVQQKVQFRSLYPSNLWLSLALLLANTTSLCLLLGYRFCKWLSPFCLVLIYISFNYLPMPSLTHSLLDPRQTKVPPQLSLNEAQHYWQLKLIDYYKDKTSKAQTEGEKLVLSKQLFEYDLLKSPEPIPGGFFFPASFWIMITLILHFLWTLYILRRI